MINGYMNIKEPPKANKILVRCFLFLVAFDQLVLDWVMVEDIMIKLKYLKKNK